MKEASDKSGFLSHHEAVGIAAEHLDILKHENPYKGAVRFLRYTNERVGLLRSEGKGYTFAYSSFQEYLAGLEIVSSADPIPIITNLVHSAHWHTPILLGIRDITDSSLHMPCYLVSGLLSSSGDAQRNHQHIILAAEVMTILLDYTDPSQNEQDRSLLEDLRYRVIAALDNLNTNTNLTLHDEHRRSIKIHLKKISEGKPNPKQSF